jgi:hypothetical protein
MFFIIDKSELKSQQDKCAFYFYRSQMPFHSKMITMCEAVEKKYQVPFWAIDADQFPKICKQYQVVRLPTVLFFKRGSHNQRIFEVVSTEKFEKVSAAIYGIETNINGENND